MNADLATILPAENTPHAIREALERLARQRQDAEKHVAELRAQRSKNLLNPRADLNENEHAIHEASVLLERLDALKPALESKLPEAKQAVEQAELEQLCNKASKAVESFRAALAGYPDLADGIAEICRLGRAAQVAVHAMATKGITGFDMPHFRIDWVVLPGMAGGMVVGQVPAPTSPYRY